MKHLIYLFIPALIISCGSAEEETSTEVAGTDSSEAFVLDSDFDWENCPKAWDLEEAMAAPDSFCILALLGHNMDEPYTEIPEEVQNMHYLRSLDVHGNKISSIPSFLSELTELDISMNSLSGLPSGLENLSKLKQLDVSYNQIGEFDDRLFDLKDLEELNAFQVPLDAFPARLYELTKLKRIAITDASFDSIPYGIGALKNLEELYLDDLSFSGVRYLPSDMAQLVRMKRLSFGGNDCCGNELEAFPSFVFSMDSLIMLNLSYGYIESIPSEIGNLQMLETLDLTGNPISSLPEELYSLPNLKYLRIGETDIPEEDWPLIKERMPNVDVEFEVEYGC